MRTRPAVLGRCFRLVTLAALFLACAAPYAHASLIRIDFNGPVATLGPVSGSLVGLPFSGYFIYDDLSPAACLTDYSLPSCHRGHVPLLKLRVNIGDHLITEAHGAGLGVSVPFGGHWGLDWNAFPQFLPAPLTYLGFTSADAVWVTFGYGDTSSGRPEFVAIYQYPATTSTVQSVPEPHTLFLGMGVLTGLALKAQWSQRAKRSRYERS